MTRKTKISCDVTREADNMLKAYCKKHERSKGYLIEKMIRKFCGEPDAGGVPPEQTDQQKAMAEYVKPKAPKASRKVISYPSNLEDQFEMLWDTKGKRGPKTGSKGAYEIFKKLAANVDDESCEAFTKMCMDDILKCSGEPGYPEMHLKSYLNQQRWIK